MKRLGCLRLNLALSPNGGGRSIAHCVALQGQSVGKLRNKSQPQWRQLQKQTDVATAILGQENELFSKRIDSREDIIYESNRL